MKRVSCAVAAAALLLGACGGSSAGNAFAARANRICARADAQLDALAAVKPTVSSYARSEHEQVAIVDAEIAKLAALRPPRQRRAVFREVVNAARSDVVLADREIEEMRAGEPAKLRALAAESSALDESTDEETARLGLTDCGRDD